MEKAYPIHPHKRDLMQFNMKRILHHLIFPVAVPASFFVIASTPVDLFGCRNRGLMVFSIALIGVLAGLGSVILGLIRRLRGDASASWFLISTIILVVPAVFLVLITR